MYLCETNRGKLVNIRYFGCRHIILLKEILKHFASIPAILE